MSGRILLDISDKRQGGYSLNVYDALCNERKLITNKLNIIKEDFYDKHNIFVYGEDSLETLQDFANTPFSKEKTDYIHNKDIKS